MTNKSSEHIHKDIQSLEMFRQNLRDMKYRVAVFGVQGSGKSTLINCIVGRAIAPSRIGAMTMIPTSYEHDSNRTEPLLIIGYWQRLNDIVKTLHQHNHKFQVRCCD